VAAGAVVVETFEDFEGRQTVRFLDGVDAPRISGGSDALDLAYAMVRRLHLTGETNHVGVVVDDDGKLVQITVGSSPGQREESFEMGIYGAGTRQWVADRLGITEWRQFSSTVEISA
jgi:hypothetical protein